MFFIVVLMTAFALFSHGFLHAFSAPLRLPRQFPPVEIAWVTNTIVSEMPLTTTTTIDMLIVTSIPTPVETEIVTLTDIVTITSALAAPTVTVTEEPSTTTATATTIVSETSTETIVEPPTTVTETVGPSATTNPGSGTYWASPPEYTDLSSFKVTNFACGKDNLQIVNGVPASASASPSALSASAQPTILPRADDSGSVLQLLYPEGSFSPSHDPVGGSDFYATPIEVANASSVTLEYSIFFPSDFDWVKGGKLPGLYGGHMRCSGGDDAKNCFSTRMMWREGGAGELYLYAPKDKQTSSLCSAPPQSFCDSTYGLSIGRGSFHFAAGAWTRIRQTVTLNTPGQQDGGFKLQVNGALVMNRTDVFYRDVPTSANDPPPTTTTAASPQETGLLSPLLGGGAPVLGSIIGALPIPSAINAPLRKRQTGVDKSDEPVLLLSSESALMDAPTTPPNDPNAPQRSSPSLLEFDLYPITTTSPSIGLHSDVEALEGGGAGPALPIGFSGLFFSTFFGGSSEDWATPTDQHTWFKDFVMAVNS
ncbi:hypothetical protein BD410DRAFT_791353 [Rickenella mellea]|uniref:Polysaccharide lyase 14 domain-containing protein n=1 Tax=Rickenella mellea TaxID=50990 RepID=A0A4Y7PYY2_9AGAM|nr:hypothetical protein BD410DRAFT_791353 [Rickenella mellea]